MPSTSSNSDSLQETREGAFASGSLSIDESRALILQLVEHYPLTTIVIDALDECDPERRSDLLEILELILQESSSLVKIFVSSRDDYDIVLHLRDYPNLELSSEKNMDDISSFVTAETSNLIKKKKLLALSTNKEKLKIEIIDQVTKNANGMLVLPSFATYVCALLMRSPGSAGLACNYRVYAAFELMKLFWNGSDDCRQSWKSYILNCMRN